MKKILYKNSITALFLFLVGCFSSKEAEVWQLIPSNAIVIVESKHLKQDLQGFSQKNWYKNLTQIPALKKKIQQWHQIDSLFKAYQDTSFLNKNPIYISLHPISKEDFGSLFFVQFEKKHIDAIREDLRNKPDFKLTERDFDHHRIYEIKHIPSQKLFSYIIYKNFLIGSEYTLLVEEAVKYIQQHTKSSLNVSTTPSNGIRIYANLGNMPKGINIFSPEMNKLYEKSFKKLNHWIYLDIIPHEDKILLNGFTLENKQDTNCITSFKTQTPVPFLLKNYISNNVAILQRWGISNTNTWENCRKNAISRLNADSLNKKYNIDLSQNWMFDEIAVGLIEKNSKEVSKILFIHTLQANELHKYLDKISENIEVVDKIKPYQENYGKFTIRQLPLKNFPQFWQGDFFEGFENCFYTQVFKVIICANDLTVLKNTLDDIEKENVWSKSVQQNIFLEQTLNDFTWGIFINTAKIWENILQYATPTWKPILAANEEIIKSFEQIALQLNVVDKALHLSGIIQFKGYSKQKEEKNHTAFQVVFKEQLYSKPLLVQNHTDKSTEVLVQDGYNKLYLISQKGKLLWEKQLAAPLIAQVQQVDVLKNNKLQYLLATPHRIHLIDRQGKEVKGFPISMPEQVFLQHFNIIGSAKNYKIIAATTAGDIFVYDKDGKKLKNWKLRKVDYRLAVPPQSIHVDNQYLTILVQENGTIRLVNEQGITLKGFPLVLNQKITSVAFVEVHPDKTKFTIITEQGELISFDSKATILDRKQLYRATKETKFTLAKDEKAKESIIISQHEAGITFFNLLGEKLGEKNIKGLKNTEVQYFNLTTTLKLIAVTDKITSQTYLWNILDENFSQKFASNQPISVSYDVKNGSINIYKAHQKLLSKVQIK